MNNVTLLGRIGKDAERIGEKGARFSVATSERYKNKDGEWVEGTEWHSVVYWNASDALLPHLSKGQQVAVEGSIHYRKHEDKYYTDIKARRVHLVGGKSAAPQDEPQHKREPVADDDLPF